MNTNVPAIDSHPSRDIVWIPGLTASGVVRRSLSSGGKPDSAHVVTAPRTNFGVLAPSVIGNTDVSGAYR